MSNPLRRSPSVRRLGLGVAGLALCVTGLSACGGSDDTDAADASATPSASPSDDASTDASDGASDGASTDASDGASDGASATTAPGAEKFCGVYSDLINDTASLVTGDQPDIAALVPKLKEYADRLEEAGLPDDAPDDVQQGFDVSLSAIRDLPDNATREDLLAAGQDTSAEDQAAANTFSQYVTTTCPDLLGSAPASPEPSAS